MATKLFYRIGMMCAVAAFVLMFISFASPFWYKSWTRVHSPFANVGLWHVCLSGWTMPRDPAMKAYVGCWWIHSTEFRLVQNELMPVWFRFIQTFCVFTLLLNLAAMVLILVYLLDSPRKRLYDKDKGRMFIINSILLLVSAFLVFLIALVFAEMSNDGSWMPRPWMNYLSWSYGFCVLSGFFDAFGGMFLFILGLIYKDKDKQEEADLPESAAEMRRRKEAEERTREKEDEAMSRPVGPSYVPPTRFAPSSHGGSQDMLHTRPVHHGSRDMLQQRQAYMGSRDHLQQRQPHHGSRDMLQQQRQPYQRSTEMVQTHKPPVAPKPNAPKVGESFV